MRGSERPDARCGPWENISQAYFANLDRMAKVYEPTTKGIGEYNLELAGLAARRLRAWLEIPASLGRCKTPQDLLSEQMKFWQTASAQYAQSWHRMATALSAGLVIPGKDVAPAHDFLSVAETPDPTGQSEPERRDRRAA